MSSAERIMTFSLAINEALHQSMAYDETVFLIGQGVKSPWYVGNTAKGLLERFGERRVIDTPVSENGITGAAVGASIAGMRAVVVHPRTDFMLYALDPIINEAANWHYMSGGRSCVPVVIWGIINRGGEQAAQHSQAIQALFAHIPGLKVVAPSTPADAKGLMIAAIQDDNPVVFMDERWLYGVKGPVPKKFYSIPIGRAAIRRPGKQVTIVSFSFMAHESLKAAEMLAVEGIDAEVLDLRSIKPLDTEAILTSVRKTGRLVVADAAWRHCGVAAEVAALCAEYCHDALKAPVVRVTLPDVPAPAARSLEAAYYPTAADVAAVVRRLVGRKRNNGKRGV
jgi:pyruvate/2-oxoglutarate/acetoin dehydrogenase E1 component